VDGRDLRRYLRTQLPRHKVPRSIIFAVRLPYRDTGKLDREQVRQVALNNGKGRGHADDQ